MTERARRPTDEGTGVYDPARPRAAAALESAVGTTGAPGGAPAGAPGESFENVERATPTYVDPGRPVEQATPTELTGRAERSEPIRVFSMKDHSEPRKPRTDERRAMQVQLRSLAELSGRHDTPIDLGHLAPPRDPRQARTRRLIDNVIWGCVAIMLACAIMLAIWLVAGR